MTDKIRNFCIIAHIDHGKSTLADRFLEVTGTIDKRNMKNQLLDTMDIEQERGITIKLQPVRMLYQGHILNLIDTPGHVDFSYEVSRSLAAVEGAILLVDASQGVQAQTIANLYLAIEQNLTIIPVMNKIDLPNANPEKVAEEIIHLIGCKREDILSCSGKTGEGVPEVLAAVIDQVPAPLNTKTSPARALIFDSFFDDYRGVIASVRMQDGEITKGDRIKFMGSGKVAEALDVGHYAPKMVSDKMLENGHTGYVVSGLKEIGNVRVGDTITLEKTPAAAQLPGYKEVKPMVFAGVFPNEGDAYSEMRDAMDKLKLNDSALFFEPEHSQALGFGFRCGFLGMLHLEIFQERLRREFEIDIIATVPSVAYHIFKTNGEELTIKSPQDLPDVQQIEHIEEPWMDVDIIVPENYIGNIMSLIAERKGIYANTEYLSSGSSQRAMLHYQMPLAPLITDFYDKLKSVSSGYASMNYDFKDYRKSDVVKMDILIAEEPVEALSLLVWRDEAHNVGKKIVNSLKDTLPRQQFVIKIQATIGGKVIAGEKISALRKDVTAKLYGGDVTRKRKLLEKQKKGKKKMMAMGKGKVEIPTEAYLAVLKR
ncbi:MAG: elongation factor 4 [Candidatus Magasanikbacteria bacterium CG_4_9_14_0_2_um_filter_42_11]|uniref:Elongation factor 4 n=1 Tax=Candidatus Magasanikbacteria bacterium CG_4_9_14_0_2_um_filter_42_11 TaxID=1974643 RepID=A0A2M8FAP3_9BACT|nr:MAG: elongation factor 4 [Candidatus Magasanikbacteria bacterium CG10_big_fil_rev_8_21_14_0_10_43_9]PIY92341.1 MAG: elongation factor 4 [Candidatus Magasanikbacteria bacterium CG_4_10_14_0_8_um_filter_42_12]PJC52802.1 MAG: elongation factor 4 [Candidatus Magasanikbacteria bacterium CG_4_9_14_0_2_um_filter_42_11]